MKVKEEVKKLIYGYSLEREKNILLILSKINEFLEKKKYPLVSYFHVKDEGIFKTLENFVSSSDIIGYLDEGIYLYLPHMDKELRDTGVDIKNEVVFEGNEAISEY